MDNKTAFASIDEYISHFPQDIQSLLQRIRTVIREAAPEATEKISYGMPAFALHGNLVYFSAFNKHIGFYPGSSGGLGAHHDEAMRYMSGKGTLQFPYGKPIPYELIRKITIFRAEQNREKAKAKAAAKAARKAD